MNPLVSISFEGLMLGLSTGSVCATTCFPFLLPYLMTEGKSGLRKQAFLLLKFFSGRLIAYLLAGGFAGWLGGRFRGRFPESFHDWALIVLAGAMVFFASERLFFKKTACLRSPKPFVSRQFPFLLGFLMGWNVCPPFLIGIDRLLEIGNPALGTIFFFAFFISSSLYLLPLFLLVPLFSSDRLRTVGAMTALLVGSGYLAKGVFALFFSR